jgi:hypothetical protein
VLFLGASGNRSGNHSDDAWALTFRFAASPNRQDLTVGAITGIAKDGWDYLWVQYGNAVDADAQALIRSPVAAYVERVYPRGDFTALGIGS